MRLTHPFHPLFGQEFELVCHRHAWSQDRVSFHNPHDFHRKFEHARDRCRPHTCQRIHALGFADCPGCPR